MPQTRSNLGQTPINADTFNLTGDLATLVDSMEVLVPVASQAAGDTVATARAAAGFAVTDARPLFIYNTTSKTIQVKDSGGWRDLDFPLGLVNQSTVTTSSAAIGGSVAVVNNIPTFTFKAGRKYRITWTFEFNGSVAGNFIDTSIHTCSTSDPASQTTGLTKIGGSSLYVAAATTGTHGEATAYYNPVSDSTLQVKFTAFVWVGGGTVVISASSTNPARYSIIDEGAAI